VLLLPVFAVLVFSTPVQAFSFCFSFGSNNNKYSPYNRYPPPYPPPPAAFYPMDPYQQFMPGPVYSPVYPPLTQQPYDVLAPVQPTQQGQWQGVIVPVPETGN
jgi:hypothetical protein